MSGDKEKKHWQNLSKGEKRYLGKFACAWCGLPFDRLECGALFERCSETQRIEKLKKCLEGYKPRKSNKHFTQYTE